MDGQNRTCFMVTERHHSGETIWTYFENWAYLISFYSNIVKTAWITFQSLVSFGRKNTLQNVGKLLVLKQNFLIFTNGFRWGHVDECYRGTWFDRRHRLFAKLFRRLLVLLKSTISFSLSFFKSYFSFGYNYYDYNQKLESLTFSI